MIRLDREICRNIDDATSREWLETNGIGGFASSTVSGINTRRYHGLLVAATDPPLGRMVLLSGFEEAVKVGEETFELSANRYPGAVHPQGFLYLRDFRLDPYPVWTYEVSGCVLERRIFMPHGENALAAAWRVIERPESDSAVSLEVRPLLAFRDYHHLRREDPEFDSSFEAYGGVVSTKPLKQAPALCFSARGAEVSRTGVWYRNFEYEVEKERGFDFAEDLFQPFALEFDLSSPAEIIVSTEEPLDAEWSILENVEVRRRAGLVARAGVSDPVARQLVLAADQFIVARGNGHSVIAGYPWFSDWGRDTMISLPGLALSTGRPEIAKEILEEFSHHFSEGMLPNRFPDEGEEPEYNTVDATLWYFEAVRAYEAATGDSAFVEMALYEKLSEAIEKHVSGTRYGIKVDDDGLLFAGEEGVQLTWMDAKVEDWVVTPRIGKPVEIQALWYNALRIMEDLATRFGDPDAEKRFGSMANLARGSFNSNFWNEAEECLFDVVSPEWSDGKIRPNQIFAVSLHHSMLTKDKARRVVDKVTDLLLTPYGLRSLAAEEGEYRPRYEGGPVERDSAYHQGTVWAWLLGPYIEAFRKVSRKSAATEKKIGEMLAAVEGHLAEAGLGQISEIFDADAPHRPRGCFAQAWSVAEILRVMKR